MPSPLTIPGVQVRTQFEPAPVLPGATGILGIVGVTDRGPVEPTPVGSFGEFLDIFGTGSNFTMPEVRGALANGVFQVVVARTSPGKGSKAKLTLSDGDRTASAPNGEPIATLEARAEGTWGNGIGVRVEQILTAGGDVKYVNVETSLGGVVVDRLKNLVMDETSPNYFFDVINESSRLVVAYDPLFETGLPSAIARTALANLGERAAFATLTAGASGVVKATAKRAGRAGNRIAVQVSAAPAGRRFESAAGPSIDVRARPGVVGTNLTAAITAAAVSGVNVVITSGGTPRSITGTSVDELVANAATDPEVEVVGLGADLPSVSTGGLLTARRDIAILTEGRDTRHYENLGSRDEITAISDTGVAFTPVGIAATLPDINDGTPLTAGRDAGAALALIGEASDEPLLELVPAPDVSAALEVAVKQSTTAPTVTFEVLADGEVVETFEGLVLDPDDPQYAPDVFEDSSAFIRAHDLFVRTHTTSFPRALARPAKLAGGASPTPDDYQEALDRLEGAEEVDLVIASVASQLAPDQIRTVHQSVVAHCTKMADVARNRIGLGSVTGDAVAEAIDHANDVRSDHFVLSTPARSEAALAGLLGRQDYFQSPTFKTIASLGVPPGAYTDAQLTQLINDNVCVVNERRRVGIIVVKGVLTSGRQINVQRTANKSVRDVKAIADKYIGLLNNEGSRNALKQQITALLLQMERDGALVPSTDGKDPAFRVDVYSTQADFANAIVRVDIAVRPVRAIDFIYATILVKN